MKVITRSSALVAALVVAPTLIAQVQQGAPRPTPLGYFRFPAIGANTIVFEAEGDLWRVPVGGGVAQRLTTHPAEETRPAISPDGRTLAFSASYEGPVEVYTMPVDGGPPTRRTFDGAAGMVVGWQDARHVIYSTRKYSTLPSTQLATIDVSNNEVTRVPLAQAADGSYDADGTLYFTRMPFQGSYTKRYKGGTAQQIWKYAPNAKAAVCLTCDYDGTSKMPMVWQDRIYFASDRDGVMNLWSMTRDGKDLRQLTHHDDFDVQSPSLSNGRIAYQDGADIWTYDVATQQDAMVPITLVSDFDQTREKWVRNPSDWISSAHISPDGERIAITARGQVFVVPADQGRLVEATPGKATRWRNAWWMPDGKNLVGLSDKSGELEFWRLATNGTGDATQITHDGKVLRWDGVVSPDGKLLAHTDKDNQLWITDVATGKATLLGQNRSGGYGDLAWSPDGQWLAYSDPQPNQFARLVLYSVASGKSTPITSDRYDSYSPAWTPDGKWIYFLSDRHFDSSVGAPWGPRQPEPYFDHQTQIYAIALTGGLRDPYQPDDETAAGDSGTANGGTANGGTANGGTANGGTANGGTAKNAKAKAVVVTVDLDGIERRLVQVPLAPGNYGNLSTDGKRLYFLSTENATGAKPQLRTYPISNKKPEIETFAADVRDYELAAGGKKVLVRKGNDMYVVDAGAKADLSKGQVSLGGWVLHFDPREEWRQEFADAWRMERDYFYDRHMNGVDWPAMRTRYAPLVERVTDRAELSDVLSQMVGELSALHIFVYGGDMRSGSDNVAPASLGARLVRDDRDGGYRVDHIYRSDPDAPNELSPLERYGVDVHEGDVITAVNGTPAMSASDIGALLRDEANKQVLLTVKPSGSASTREVIVTPISQAQETRLRYSEWEYTRRQTVEQRSNGTIGYVHLRAMTGDDMAQWERDFYPAFNREGLIIDVRHNGGGNIDSWILEKLMRKAWFYFQPRVGDPTWNMQYAFRGHIVLLVDENTASDGEAFAEGFRRLGLGKVIGKRTWGGEIWLTSSNRLVDRGIATAAEIGVYGPESKWLIEGRGVEPDVVVDNEPHATFLGGDAQLDAAIAALQQQIAESPVEVPKTPAYPNKAAKVLQAGEPKKP